MLVNRKHNIRTVRFNIGKGRKTNTAKGDKQTNCQTWRMKENRRIERKVKR